MIDSEIDYQKAAHEEIEGLRTAWDKKLMVLADLYRLKPEKKKKNRKEDENEQISK